MTRRTALGRYGLCAWALFLGIAAAARAEDAEVKGWVERLQARDGRVRAGAAKALGLLGGDLGAGEPALRAALNDPDPEVRVAAAVALGQQASTVTNGVEKLFTALHAPDEAARVAAVEVLAWAGCEDIESVAAALREATEDASPRVRIHALGAWLARSGYPIHKGAFDWAVSALRQEYEKADAALRSEAVGLAKEHPAVASAVADQLIALLVHEDLPLRRAAAQALTCAMLISPDPANFRAARADADGRVRVYAAGSLLDFKEETAAALAVLQRELSNADAEVRACAARTLSRAAWSAAFESKGPLPELVKAAQDPDARVRAEAVTALGGYQSGGIVEAVTSALQDPDLEVRASAFAVSSLASHLPERLDPIFSAAVKDADPRIRLHALAAWMHTREEAVNDPAIVLAVRAALKDRCSGLRAYALRCLCSRDDAQGDIVAALHDSSPVVRYTAVIGLHEVAADAKVAVPALLQALQDPDPLVRRYAALAMGEDPAEATTFLPALAGALKDPSAVVRQSAAESLGRFGAAAQSVVPSLVELQKDPSPSVRFRAAAALARIDPATAAKHDLAPLLAAHLQDEGELSAVTAASALASLGAAARPAVPQLIACLTGRGRERAISTVRADCIRCLGELGPAAAAAAPVLHRLADDRWEEEKLRTAARAALELIEPKK